MRLPRGFEPDPATEPLQAQVVTYKNAKAFEKDSANRFRMGWTVAAQSQSAGRVTATRVATLGVAALFAKKDRGLTVTWMPPTSAPA
jgi:hypothetical protein